LFLLHHAVSPFSELHNNNLLYLLWHSNLRVKNVSRLCFRKVLLVSSLQSCKACQERAQQTVKCHFHTNCAISRQVYVHALLVQHLYSAVFFKENVRCPVWTCRDPIPLILGTRFSLILGIRYSILGTRFSLILGTRFSILGTPIGSLKDIKKKLDIVYIIFFGLIH